MKKILLLLLFTIASYGQAVFDEGIQITGNANSATATKVNVQEANGKVNTQAINTAFNKNFGLNSGDVVGANTLLNQYSTTPVDWTATAFNSGQVVFYAGKQWIAKIATVAGDVPAASSKWEEITFDALANKTKPVDQTIIDGSTNAVSGNAVFDGLALKSNIGHTHVASQITDLSKASVGLGNVDNTSDLSKPLSTATINALATKAPISSVHNPVTLGTANGLSLSTQQISLGLASSGVTGALSGTDWNTFNGKFNTPTGLTTNYLPKWNGSGFGNSNIFDNGTNIGIGTTATTLSKLHTKGDDGNFIGYFYNNSGTAGQVKGVVIEAGTNTSDFALLVNSSQGSPYFKVNGNGNVGIGTTSPTANLTVKGAYSVGSSIPTDWALLSAGRMGVAKNNKGLYFDIYNDYAEVSTYDWSLGQTFPMVFQGNGGNSMFGTNVDNGSKVQVNGTISASPATTANQVPTWGQVQAIVKPYKVYTALLTQTGTNAPVAIVLENTLGGTVTFERTGVGNYSAVSAGNLFTLNKTVVFNSSGQFVGTYNFYPTNTSRVLLNNVNVSGVAADSLMRILSIEIRVYL